MRVLQSQSDAIGLGYKEERIRLEKKYQVMLEPYLVRGSELVSGEVDVPVSENCNTGKDLFSSDAVINALSHSCCQFHVVRQKQFMKAFLGTGLNASSIILRFS